MTAIVTAVCSSPGHTFSKPVREAITLVAGLGVAGDAHQGVMVRHRSRVRADPGQPNLRQVHLIHGELHDALQQAGFNVAEGTLGESPRAASTCWTCRATACCTWAARPSCASPACAIRAHNWTATSAA